MKEWWQKARAFFREVSVESKRVTWPSRKEVVNSTTVVLIVTVVIAFFLGAVDVGLSRIVRLILR
jgi:preprotein translocase subunit SecE